ncbi:glycosyltransferase [Micromonospora sp. NBC_01796]|uniref:glycosyltransferase n=1 Tax=Micromonospora sp. NBC_01796 TaxID=2975987 RepID=UPI002DD8E509|nr:glycosyltransferase [Micromonospora sp. NBC_01796]WSA84528.1 glycosyltransferase [Micromonospora sp. NBC_01796]
MEELAAVADPMTGRRVAPLRVCLIICQLGLGGAEKQLVLLAEGLSRLGVEVSVVVLTGAGPREDALRVAGVPVVHLGLRQPGGWRAVPPLLATWGRLVRQLRRSRPDVVHAFLFNSYVLGAPAARLARVPVFVAGRRSLDDFKRGRRWVLAVERISARMTHLLVANAHAVADRVRETERVPAGGLAVIYNGLPPAAFAGAEPTPLDSAHPVVLCVANLRGLKGHKHLIDAAALLRDRGLTCTLALVGDGPERDALRRHAALTGIDARLLGARLDMDGLLARADVVALPSMTEGMSNAVMEAMAAGRAVVASAVGGIPELLAEGRGLLVRPGDPVGLANALERLLRDRAYAESVGRAARDWSRVHLAADLMVHRHLALYDTLVRR